MLLAIGMFFTACQSEEEDFFDSSAAERLAASKATYTQRLPQATAGWAMEFYPTNGNSAPKGAGYLLLAKFNTDRSVSIAFKNTMTDWVYQEDTSLWEVIADQGPVLSFNTYNKCLHIFADPAFYDTGLGYEGDYEFEIISLEDNARFAMLKGKKRGTYVRMTRLEEGTDFEQYLTEVDSIQSTLFDPTAPNDLLICFGDKRYIINDVTDGFLSFYPEGGDAISQTESHPFLITKRDGKYYLRFRDAFEREDYEPKVQELYYDPAQDMFVGLEESTFTIQGYPAYKFFDEHITAKGTNKFEIGLTSEMSDKFKSYMDALVADFTTMKSNRGKAYAFIGLRLAWDNKNDSYQWSVRYTPGTTSPTFAAYNFNYESGDGRVKFTYTTPGVDAKGSDAASTNVRNALQAVTTITEVLSQEFIVTENKTKFNLNTLKLTSATDPDLWFVVSL